MGALRSERDFVLLFCLHSFIALRSAFVALALPLVVVVYHMYLLALVAASVSLRLTIVRRWMIILRLCRCFSWISMVRWDVHWE